MTNGRKGKRTTAELAALSDSQDNLNHALHTSGMTAVMALPHWRTAEIGGLEAEAFSVLLKRVRANPWAMSLFLSPYFRPSYTRKRLRLVRTPVRHLGFRSPPQTPELLGAVSERGLLCPPDTAVWLADSDEPIDGLCFMLSEPIPNSGGVPSLFAIDATGARSLLVGASARPSERWCLDNKVVFIVP